MRPNILCRCYWLIETSDNNNYNDNDNDDNDHVAIAAVTPLESEEEPDSGLASNPQNPERRNDDHHHDCQMINLALPKEIKLGRKNQNIRKMIRNASMDMMDLLLQYNSLRCPNNSFTTHQMRPLDFCSTIHQVCCLFDKDDPKHMCIEEIGYSSNIKARYSQEILEQCLILVSPWTIYPELDLLLIKVVDELLWDIWKNKFDKPLPRDFRCCIKSIDPGSNLLHTTM